MQLRTGHGSSILWGRSKWAQALLCGSSFATGGALLVYFIFDIPLLAGLAATVGLAAGVWRVIWSAMTRIEKDEVLRRVIIGLLAGAMATLAYDVSRWALVELTRAQLHPFAAWPLFGELLGAGHHETFLAFAIGFAFHVANGLSFAVGYTIVWAEKGPVWGVAWALVLETLMVSFYPGWLGLKALDEFLSVTIFGHVAYGLVLGWFAQRRAQAPRSVMQ